MREESAVRPTSLYCVDKRPELNLYPKESGLTPERSPINFDINLVGAPPEVEQLVNNIKQVAEQFLYHWKTFPIVLPQPVSLTNSGNENDDICLDSPNSFYKRRGHSKGNSNLRDLFIAPSFDELDAVAVDSKGEPIRLNNKQLDSCRERGLHKDKYGKPKKLNFEQLESIRTRGEFEVNSLNFPGQVHKWRVSELLQKGVVRTRETLLNDLALAIRFIIITALNRFTSDHFFSLKHSLKSFYDGLMLLLDLLIGLPSLKAHNLDARIREERCRYLVTELVCLPEYCDNIEIFCDWLRKEIKRAATEKCPPMPTVTPSVHYQHHRTPPVNVPYRYETAQGGQYIDLKLMDKDIMRKATPILREILERESRGWFLHFRERLIAELRLEKLTDKEIETKVNEAVTNEYLQRVYNAILTNADLALLGETIAELLVEQAQSVVLMHKSMDHVKRDLNEHLNRLKDNLSFSYPVLSRVSPWLRGCLDTAQNLYAREHQWNVHELAIEMCHAQKLNQAVYFLNRDLTFMREREPALVRELSKVKVATRQYVWATQIWLPKNWIIKRCFQGDTKIIPTVLSNQPTSITTPRSDPSQPVFLVEREIIRTTSCRWPFWRWMNYAQRTWSWSFNVMFLFGIVIPWYSPFGLRALISFEPFITDWELSQVNGTLFPRKSSLTLTMSSRLITLWRHISKSRTNFETKPDTGFIGKGLTRHLNRFWNYVIKGLFGTVAMVILFPLVTILITFVSIAIAITTFIWMPILTLLLHIFMAFVYDFDSPTHNSNNTSTQHNFSKSIKNRHFIFFQAIIGNIFMFAIVQPICAFVVAVIICPIVSLVIATAGLIRYWIRLVWDSFIFHTIIKKRGRIPAQDSFVVKRIAGPGLVNDYFLQIRPEQALAAFEAKLELEQLNIYQRCTEQLILQPQKDYAAFVEACFGPFSVQLAKTTRSGAGPYKMLEKECHDLLSCLHEKLERRKRDLQTGLSAVVRSKIKLTTNDLNVTLYQSALMLERFYPENIFAHLVNQTVDEFWETRGIQPGDWISLAGLLYTDIFSIDFLTPLDQQTQTSFKLEADSQIDLNKYTELVQQNSDLINPPDLLGAIYTPRGNIRVEFPYLDLSVFNPRTTKVVNYYYSSPSKQQLTDTITLTTLKSRRFKQNRSKSNQSRMSNCPNETRRSNTTTTTDKYLWQPWKRQHKPFVPDKLMIPLPVPHPVHIAVIVHNRDCSNEKPISIDSELCQNILRSVEDSQMMSAMVARYRGGGCFETGYQSTTEHSSSSETDQSDDKDMTNINMTTIQADIVPRPKQSNEIKPNNCYHWTLSQWTATQSNNGGGSSRKRLSNTTIRVDLASPEDVTLDTDSNQVVFNAYGTTV